MHFFNFSQGLEFKGILHFRCYGSLPLYSKGKRFSKIAKQFFVNQRWILFKKKF